MLHVFVATTPAKDDSGQILADKAAQLAWWTEYLSGLLTRPSPIAGSEDLGHFRGSGRIRDTDQSINVEQPSPLDALSSIKGMRNNRVLQNHCVDAW